MLDNEKQFKQFINHLNIDDAPRTDHQQNLKARALEAHTNANAVQSRTSNPLTWRIIMSRPTSKFAAGFILAITLVSLIALLQLYPAGNIAFAQILKQVHKVQTVTFITTTTSKDGSIESHTSMMDDAGRFRSELPGGKVATGSLQRGEIITLDPVAKEAFVIKGMYPAPNMFEKLKQLQQEHGMPIGEREIDGRKTTGFKVNDGNDKFTIWADVETGRPVLIEAFPINDPQNPGMSAVAHDFVYDQPIDAALFDMTIPDDYTVQNFGGVPIDQQQPPATPQQAKALTITPLIGFTNAPFFTSKKQLLDILGQPDDIQHDIDLRYLSKGFTVMAHPKVGLYTINCFSKASAGPFALNDFPGQTDKGIRMGSTRAQVIAAYGQPDKIDKRTPRMTNLEYTDLKTNFTLLDDKVVNMLFACPRPENPKSTE